MVERTQGKVAILTMPVHAFLELLKLVFFPKHREACFRANLQRSAQKSLNVQLTAATCIAKEASN